MSKIKVNFIVDKAPLYSKKIAPSESIKNLRINYNISNELIFLTNDGFDILKEDEKDYTVEDCITEENKVILKKIEKQKEQENKKLLNTPIAESKFIKNKDNLDLYLYPTFELTKGEEKNSIVVQVVRKIENRKTTLLNVFINYLMGINYEDNFRYIIINEEFNKKQDQSQTSEVTIYNIKAPHGTIIQIIDTPGFGDTYGGIE